MIDDETDRPDDPARAIALSDDAERALANKLAGIEKRKATIRQTMLGAKGKRAAPKAPATDVAARPRPNRRPRPKLDAVAAPCKSDITSDITSDIASDIVVATASIAPAEPVPRKRQVKRRAVSQAQLVARLSNLIARELDVIDEITGITDSADARRGDAERHARTVAVLSRVLGEFRKFQGDAQGSSDDDDRPRDLDEMRARLSRRLDQRLKRGGGASVADDDGGGDELPG